MSKIGRVFSVSRLGLGRHFVFVASKYHSTLCTKSSILNPLLHRLLQESNSSIKTALDLEENLTLKNDSLFWEPLITALTSSSPEKARLVLEWKFEKMLKENERDQGCYSDLICLCGKVQKIPFAIQVFTSMEARGVRPTSTVFNSLISACLSSSNLTTALSLFEIMERSEDCKPNSATYNAFISVYSKLGDCKAMHSWYSASKKVGFSPNVETYEALIAGFIISKEVDIANRCYEEMMSSGITPNVFILENMLQGLCEQKKLSKIKQFLKFMLNGGWNMNGRMVKKLLGLYSELGMVEELEELLRVLMSSNQDLEVLSQVHCGIIRMYALSDRLDDMEFSVGRMLKQGMSFTCPGDLEKVVCSYFRRAAYDRLDLFLDRIRESYNLPRSTYDILVAGYKRVGLYEKLDLVMKDMKLAGFLES